MVGFVLCAERRIEPWMQFPQRHEFFDAVGGEQVVVVKQQNLVAERALEQARDVARLAKRRLVPRITDALFAQLVRITRREQLRGARIV